MSRSAAAERWRAKRRMTSPGRKRTQFDSKPDLVECICGQDDCRCGLKQRAIDVKVELKRRAQIVKDDLFGHLMTESRDDDRSRFGVVGGVGFDRVAPIPAIGRANGHIGRAQYCRRLVREWKRRMLLSPAAG